MKHQDADTIMAHNIDQDYSNIIYFMDNCTAQKKSWTLFTAMVDIINSNMIAANKITFKYLEAGHTLMSMSMTSIRNR